jgi:hypothetical protein
MRLRAKLAPGFGKKKRPIAGAPVGQGPAVGIEIAAHTLGAEIERYDQCYETNYLQR